MDGNKHRHYHALNLIGYGLAKFDMELVRQLGFSSKQSLYDYIVEIGMVETASTVKNRQDLFDPFFPNERKGWWQKGDAYIHRKITIDKLFGDLDARAYSKVLNIQLNIETQRLQESTAEPILKSKFKQLQTTGYEAELFFIHNFQTIDCFKNGVLEDARLLGDGYDFQVQAGSKYFLAEVKGVRRESGSVRLTQKEFERADEYKQNYALSVVSNLHENPKIDVVFDPIASLIFEEHTTECKQISYHSKNIKW